MKTLESFFKEVEQWFADGGVGNLVVFRSPRSQFVDCIYEETIKLFELDRDARALVEAVFEFFDAEKMEFYRNSDGDPDRVKVTRRG